MGQAYFGEEGIGATDVCVKVMKAEKVHNVGESSPVLGQAVT